MNQMKEEIYQWRRGIFDNYRIIIELHPHVLMLDINLCLAQEISPKLTVIGFAKYQVRIDDVIFPRTLCV